MYLLHKAEVYLQCSYHSQCRIKLLSSLPIKEHSHNSKPKQCSRVKKKKLTYVSYPIQTNTKLQIILIFHLHIHGEYMNNFEKKILN